LATYERGSLKRKVMREVCIVVPGWNQVALTASDRFKRVKRGINHKENRMWRGMGEAYSNPLRWIKSCIKEIRKRLNVEISDIGPYLR